MTQQDLIESGSQPMVTQANPLAMVQAALERGMDAETIGKFMDLADRHEAKQAKRDFDEAMSRFREECPVIRRTADAHNSKYAKLSNVITAIKGTMADCGLSHSWRTEQDSGLISVTCVVSHVGGHSERTTLAGEPDKSGSKNSIQAIGSTVSYLERYTLFAILGIASSDMDDDGGSAGQESDLIDPATQADIDALVDEVLKTPEQRVNFSGWLKTKIGAANGFVRNIPSAKAADVVAMLEKKRAAS